MENSTFIFGSELQGRGLATTTDIFIGTAILVTSFLATLLGIMNIVIIKKMTLFHNAFGYFWASRTVGELGSNLVHMLYTGPVTILQPTNIPMFIGLSAFSINYWFGCAACVMHQFVSLNRFVAVCFPLSYSRIFRLEYCKMAIVACWAECLAVVAAYYIFPCNLVGYGPTFYDFIFVKCEAAMNRDYSLVGTVVNRFCLVVCSGTMVLDLITLIRIIYLQKTLKLKTQTKSFRRDVRFFAQSSIQNVTMIIALALIVIVNNSQSTPLALTATAVNSFILTTLNNSLAMVIFNPEVREKISLRFFITLSKVEDSSSNSNVNTNVRSRSNTWARPSERS
uniref:G_PROTEIN_RECEP_F1_2 domain-containing protein n=1 Tax=Steinernema glaseri TaxID=37863 RepID=A0A1I7YZC7_9BILA